MTKKTHKKEKQTNNDNQKNPPTTKKPPPPKKLIHIILWMNLKSITSKRKEQDTGDYYIMQNSFYEILDKKKLW